MADHHHRQVPARGLHHRAQVVDDRLEVLHQRRFSGRLAVSAMVRPHHRGPARVQCRGDVLVASDVLSVTVDEHHQPRRIVDGPSADVAHAGDAKWSDRVYGATWVFASVSSAVAAAPRRRVVGDAM